MKNTFKLIGTVAEAILDAKVLSVGDVIFIGTMFTVGLWIGGEHITLVNKREKETLEHCRALGGDISDWIRI